MPEHIEPEISNESTELVESTLTPWEVKGTINYLAQIEQFGTQAIDGKLIERWERVTGKKVHRFIRRGLVFSHQDIDKILDCVEKGIPLYIYTGRGPSTGSMHMGHKIPFMLAKYLQEALNCIIIIQMSDDEKFLFKEGSTPLDLEGYRKLAYKNAKDIIACGFQPDKTFIFSNLESNGGDLYFNNVLIMKDTKMNNIKSIYGLGESLPESALHILKEHLKTETDEKVIGEINGVLKKFSGQSANLGQCAWPAFQCGPAFCTSFRNIFVDALKRCIFTKGSTLPPNILTNMKKALNELNTLGSTQSIMCLVPMAIDQGPYFRMARDSAKTLGCPEPAVIHSEFLPGLKQSHGKMSSSTDNENSTLFLDMDIDKVGKTIKRYAFSGGGDTLENHQKNGGNIKTDIPYQYLTYFLESDDELKKIAQEYSDGTMGTGAIKNLVADLITNEIKTHQEAVKQIDDECVAQFFDPEFARDIGGCYDRQSIDTEGIDYSKYGINFDRTFGIKQKCNV